MSVLEKQHSESYSIYWNSAGEWQVKSAMLFYTDDGELIAGIAVNDGQYENWLKKFASQINGRYGYISFENPPPDARSNFIEICKNSDQSKMIEGKIILD